MTVPLNTPIAGKIKQAFEKKFEKAKSSRSSDGSIISKGEWYEIFKKYKLFDVDDSPELTGDQKHAVPSEDQTYQSDLIDAFIECMEDLFLGSFFDGVGDTIQNLIDKTLVKAMTADGKINGLADTVSSIPVPGLQVVKVANDTTGSLISLSHGMSPFDIDVIPRLSFNLPSLPFDFANLLESGYIMPDWYFVRRQESARNKFYHSGKSNQGLILGVGIDFSTLDENTLSKVFIVNAVNKFGKITGDILTGIDKSTFETMKTVIGLRGQDAMDKLDERDIRNLSLHEGQILGSFVRYAEMSYWKPMNNPSNWMHAHWGSIANNVFPSGLRTAIASYTYNHGPTLTKDKTTTSAFISYCIQIGLYYKMGYEFPVAYTHLGKTADGGGFEDIDSTLTTTINGSSYNVKYDNTVATGIDGNNYIVDESTPIVVDRIPRNGSIANIYFTLAADLLSRRTYGSISDKVTARNLRLRRVEEANLVYTDVFGPDKTIKFAKSPNSQVYEHSSDSLKTRYFDVLINGIVMRYDNLNGPATASNGTLPKDNGTLSTIGYVDGDYDDYYAPQVEHEFKSNQKKLRFWNAAFFNDAVTEAEINKN